MKCAKIAALRWRAVALLELELVAEEGVAAGGVDEITRAHLACMALPHRARVTETESDAVVALTDLGVLVRAPPRHAGRCGTGFRRIPRASPGRHNPAGVPAILEKSKTLKPRSLSAGKSAAGLRMPMRSTSSSTPRRSRMGMFIGSSDSPMWKRGWRFFSNSCTLRPRRASSVAAVVPAGPAADDDDVAVQAAISRGFLVTPLESEALSRGYNSRLLSAHSRAALSLP